MTTLRESLTEARSKFEELPAGECRRLVDNVLNDPSLTENLEGWPVDVCHIDTDVGCAWDVDAFLREVNKEPF